ncbi:MAG: superoxide dismutase family protein [Acidobacteria bacterium]|nr:superoxide dismutase family protein [Acidobacteriaceae bacterium]MBV9608836.1 superoxide dismutase family protein [Acidobacteriota bacterium]
MQRAYALVGLVLAIALLAWSVAAAQRNKKPRQQQVVELKNAKGDSVGTATLTRAKQGVIITLNVNGLPPGEHAIHIHQDAKCEANPAAPQDAFKSAGPHFNPEGRKHGLQSPEGAHAGDMANFTVAKDGTSTARIFNTKVTMETDVSYSVYSNGGTALVIHEKPDDMKTDPSGNSGARIACGVITPPK